MPGLMPTNSTRGDGRIRSRSGLSGFARGMAPSSYVECRMSNVAGHGGPAPQLSAHGGFDDLVVQGGADPLQLRRAREGRAHDLELREEPARAEAPARSAERGRRPLRSPGPRK